MIPQNRSLRGADVAKQGSQARTACRLFAGLGVLPPFVENLDKLCGVSHPFCENAGKTVFLTGKYWAAKGKSKEKEVQGNEGRK